MATEQQKLEKLIYNRIFGNKGSMTIAEFTDAFKTIIEHILRFEKTLTDKNDLASTNLEAALKRLTEESRTEVITDLTLFKKEASVSIAQALENVAKRAAQVKDGETPSNKQLLALITPLIPAPLLPTDTALNRLIAALIPKPIPGSPDSGEDIIKKINKDKTLGLVIKKEHLEGWKELEDRIRTAIANTHNTGGGYLDVWRTGVSNTTRKLTVSSVAPANPAINDLWVDTS